MCSAASGRRAGGRGGAGGRAGGRAEGAARHPNAALSCCATVGGHPAPAGQPAREAQAGQARSLQARGGGGAPEGRCWGLSHNVQPLGNSNVAVEFKKNAICCMHFEAAELRRRGGQASLQLWGTPGAAALWA